MKKTVLIAGALVIGLSAYFSFVLRPEKSPVRTVTQSTSSTTPIARSSPSGTTLLSLPFDPAGLPSRPKSFGIYPFGLKSSEHPEGHAGFNIETTSATPVLAPADMKIASISSPAGRPDEHNIEADAVSGSMKFEYLRVGNLMPGVKVGSIVKAGQQFALPGSNHSLGVYMFHFGVLDDRKSAVCPAQSVWQPGAWAELSKLLAHSISDTGKPFTTLCYSAAPIPLSARHIE